MGALPFLLPVGVIPAPLLLLAASCLGWSADNWCTCPTPCCLPSARDSGADDAIAFERLRHHVFLQLVAVLTDMRIELTPAGGVFRLEGSFDKASGPETP